MKAIPTHIVPVERPRNFDRPQLTIALVEASKLVRARKARRQFSVDGANLSIAVLDTGINATHVDFAGRIRAQRNFTTDNGGRADDAGDGNSHGTNVTGIATARKGLHQGIAPGAGIVSVKALDNRGNGTFADIQRGLEWVLEQQDNLGISVVCMSLGDPGNYQTDSDFSGGEFDSILNNLKQAGVAVCIAAGNRYAHHDSQQGMAFPAILRHGISVGAVFDADVGEMDYGSGVLARATGPDLLTPFSQRLHEDIHADCRTDIFAPGAPIRSAGIGGTHAESVQQGTSQAAPVVAGVTLLMQQFYLRETGVLPKVDHLVTWMRRGAVSIIDGDDENDTVRNTNKKFQRVDAVGALDAVASHLDKQLYAAGSTAVA